MRQLVCYRRMTNTPLMPPHDPPFRARDVRDLYRKGTWAYALGKPAWTHPQYKKAVAIARRGRKGQPAFNPWWIRNWSDVCAVIDGCYMDERRGWKAVEWEQMLHHFEDQWAGKPFILSDWQKYDLEIPLFGWMRSEQVNKNGVIEPVRRFKRTITFIPKKNGKTTLCAARALYMTGPDGWRGCETYTISSAAKQSYIMFRAGMEMLKLSPDILSEFEIIKSRHRIVHLESASYWQALAEAPESTEGFKVNAVMKDEIHIWKNKKTYDSFKYSMAAKSEPIDSTISTAGEYDPVSIGYDEYKYVKAVLFAENGAEADWSLQGFVCELDTSEGSKELELWDDRWIAVKTSPNIDITIKLSEDQEKCIEVKNRPHQLNNFLWKRRNVWVNSLSVWIPKQTWDNCAAEYTEDDLEGLVCYGGIDASIKHDLTSLCLCFPPQGDLTKWRFWWYFWVPEDRVSEHDEQNHGWYSMWIKAGHVLTTPGLSIDQEYIRAKIHECCARFQLRTIGADQRYCGKLLQDLENDGIDAGPFGQGFPAMNEPIEKIEALIDDGILEHPGNPAQDWQISHAHLRQHVDGLKKIVKANEDQKLKVDGVITMIESCGTALLDEVGVFDAAELIR